MAVTRKTDMRANIAAIKVEETAADTLTIAKFNFPFSIMDKMALVIHRIEYWVVALSNLNTAEDDVTVGLIAGNTILSILDQADPILLDSIRITRHDIGTAGSGFFSTMPYVKDLSMLPGGGIMVAPSPLAAAIKGSGASAAINAWVKLFYTYQQLSTDEYWELVESRRIISS